ncbi:hypothetical protein Trydic_g3567 [Trypoxylus dichotomus]
MRWEAIKPLGLRSEGRWNETGAQCSSLDLKIMALAVRRPVSSGTGRPSDEFSTLYKIPSPQRYFSNASDRFPSKYVLCALH